MRISEALGQENLGLGVEGADSLNGDRNLPHQICVRTLVIEENFGFFEKFAAAVRAIAEGVG